MQCPLINVLCSLLKTLLNNIGPVTGTNQLLMPCCLVTNKPQPVNLEALVGGFCYFWAEPGYPFPVFVSSEIITYLSNTLHSHLIANFIKYGVFTLNN